MNWYVARDASTNEPQLAIHVARISAWRRLEDKLEVIVDGHPIRLDMDHEGTRLLLDELTAYLTPPPSERPTPEQLRGHRQ